MNPFEAFGPLLDHTIEEGVLVALMLLGMVVLAVCAAALVKHLRSG